MRSSALLVAVLFGLALSAQAAPVVDLAWDAADDSVYADGWQNGDDGGFGWNGGWIFRQMGDTSGGGYDIATSSLNGVVPGDIDTNGVAWRLYASNGATVGADRRFAAPMEIGDTFSIDLDIADYPLDVFAIIDFANGTSPVPRMSFGVRDGAPNYYYYDAAGDVDSSVPVNAAGLHVEFTMTGADTYKMRLVPGVGDEATRSGVLQGSGAIAKVGVYLTADESPTMREAFFNSAHLVPEPGGASAAMGAAAALGALLYRRRRRCG
jgi:hypothetical protein